MPGTSRRAEFSASTRRALVDVAERLFTEHGYAATSLDAIVAGADVTKGALYHHYSGKQALFEAVFERVESAGAQSIQDALTGDQDPWDKALSGLRAFLEVVRQPSYSRIVIQDGPSVLGYERFREQEERSTFAYVLDIVRAVLSSGDWSLGRRDGAHLRPDLLRRDVVVGCQRVDAPTTPTPRPSGWSWRSGSSWPASARWPTRAWRCRPRPRPASTS